MIKKNRAGLVLLWLLLGILPLIDGFSYYLSPLYERPYLSVHEAFKPSGIIGQGLGIFGSLMIIVGVVSYIVRKRWSVLGRFGKLRSWLTFHIFLCTLGPFYILLHTTFKIGNIASISFWSMAIVVFSGIFGRYVYIHIPKSDAGIFLGERQLLDSQEALLKGVREITGMSVTEVDALQQQFVLTMSGSYLDAIWKTIRFDLARTGILKKINGQLDLVGVGSSQKSEAVSLLYKNSRIEQQRHVSEAFKKLFGYWHVLHIPLAVVMLLTFLVHVGAAIAFGYTWIF